MVDIDDQSGVEGEGLEAVQETVCLVELNLGSLGPIIIWTIRDLRKGGLLQLTSSACGLRWFS